ncbi:MAG: CHC2 zinc finger domain-containing protein [Nitrososphaera sp.]|nr:CHC2 zinc finger domain-containing protein [Nitrososphaera sp.]
MSAWINFKELRAKLDFEQVLRHCGVEIIRKGDQHHGFCPLPMHGGERKKSESFSANLKKGIFRCFSCGAQGNVLDFAVLKAGLDPDSGEDLRRVALELQAKFCPELTSEKPVRKRLAERDEQPELKPVKVEQPISKPAEKQVRINEPLDFELKRLEPNHPYLLDRGFSRETIVRFGLGYCEKGYHAGRIAIPLHDHGDKLIGYAGRIVDDRKIDNDHPRYLFPGTRERSGVSHEFRKTEFLYNGSSHTAPLSELVVVESFTGVWWLTQMGFPNVVALMGSSCSERQSQLVAKTVTEDGRVWIIPDGDAAGEQCASSLLSLVSPLRFVRWLKLEGSKQPTDYPGAFFRDEFG